MFCSNGEQSSTYHTIPYRVVSHKEHVLVYRNTRSHRVTTHQNKGQWQGRALQALAFNADDIVVFIRCPRKCDTDATYTYAYHAHVHTTVHTTRSAKASVRAHTKAYISSRTIIDMTCVSLDGL